MSRKRPPEGLKLFAILCIIVVLAVGLALALSLGGPATSQVLTRAQVTPTEQSACFFCSITHFFQAVVQAVVQVVNSIGNELNSTACNVLGGGSDQTIFGGCSSGGGGGGGGSTPAPPAPPPPTCGTDITLTTACGFNVSTSGGISSGSALVLPNQTATLAWNCPASAGYSSSFGSGGAFNTGGGLSGNDPQEPSNTTTYTLTCDAPGGNSTASVVVTVVPVALSITPSANRVDRGSATTLSWSADDLSTGMTCSIASTPAGIFNSAWDGSGTSWTGSDVPTEQTINQQTIFTLSCQTPAGGLSASATVGIVPSFQEI